MSDSDNFGSDLESDSFGSHLGASDEEVDDECNVNAVRMQPTLDVGKIASEQQDWGRPKTLEDECVLQVPDDEDLYDDEALARSALAKRRVQALLKSAQELANPFDKLVADGGEVLTEDEHNVFKVFNRVFIALCSQVHDRAMNAANKDASSMGDYFNMVQGDMDRLVTAIVNGDSYHVYVHRKEFFDSYMEDFHDIDIKPHALLGCNSKNSKLAEDTDYDVDAEWELHPGSTYQDYGVPEFMELVTVKADARARGDVALAVRAYLDDIDDIDDIDISTSTDTSTSTVVAEGLCAFLADGKGFVFDGLTYEPCSVYQFVECYFHDETEDGTRYYIDVECLRRVQEMIPGTYHYSDESVPESFVPAGVYFGYLPKSQEQEIDDISGGESNPLPFKYFPWDAEMHRSINAELQWLQDCIIEHGEYDVKTDLFDLLIDHCDDDSGKRTKWTKLAKKLRKKLKRKHPNIREVTKKVTQKLDDWKAAQQSDSSTSSDSSSDSE